MKILWLSHLLPYPPKGGVLQRSHHLLLQAAARHEVHLFALVQRAQHPGQDEVAEAIRELSKSCARVEAFPIPSDRSRWHWATMAALNYFDPMPYDVNWLSAPELHDRLATIATTERFDLIHVDTLGLMPYTERFEGTPVVLNHHNIESQMMKRRAGKEPSAWRQVYFRREAKKLERMERTVCPRAATNIVVSDLDAERLTEITARARTHVVDNGVDIDYFRPVAPGLVPGPASSAARLIFAGGMNWYPNREAVLYFLREIWPGLAADRLDRRITIVGQDPPPELIAAATSDRRITVTGFVPDVRPYLDEATIYVCPIRDGGGTRLKILDALAMAKPLVATELAVEGLDLIEGTHYLRAETPEEYIEQIGRLEVDADLRTRLATAGRELVERRYAWDVLGEKLEIAYQAALGSSPTRVPG